MPRSEERVTPLELFFDLVFVLALTQCTALMADDASWGGLGKGLLVLGLLWWSWVGYAWLTSVVDPEEGAVRFAIFAAMAALLVVALCVPEAFGDSGLLFAVAYGAVRFGQIALFVLASRDDPALRSSVRAWLAARPRRAAGGRRRAVRRPTTQAAFWTVALLLDMLEPYLFGSEGWKLAPSHFAERHGLIVIIALGESIVAIGVGAEADVDAGVVAAAVLGIVVAAALWWLYFDVVALVAERRLSNATVGREQNEIARDSFSYLHFPMVAGIVLLALGLEEDARARGRAAEAGPGRRDARRHGALPARARRLPLAQRAPLQLPAAGVRRGAAGADPGGGRAGRAGDARDPRGDPGGADRLRDRRTSPSCAIGCVTSSRRRRDQGSSA